MMGNGPTTDAGTRPSVRFVRAKLPSGELSGEGKVWLFENDAVLQELDLVLFGAPSERPASLVEFETRIGHYRVSCTRGSAWKIESLTGRVLPYLELDPGFLFLGLPRSSTARDHALRTIQPDSTDMRRELDVRARRLERIAEELHRSEDPHECALPSSPFDVLEEGLNRLLKADAEEVDRRLNAAAAVGDCLNDLKHAAESVASSASHELDQLASSLANVESVLRDPARAKRSRSHILLFMALLIPGIAVSAAGVLLHEPILALGGAAVAAGVLGPGLALSKLRRRRRRQALATAEKLRRRAREVLVRARLAETEGEIDAETLKAAALRLSQRELKLRLVKRLEKAALTRGELATLEERRQSCMLASDPDAAPSTSMVSLAALKQHLLEARDQWERAAMRLESDSNRRGIRRGAAVLAQLEASRLRREIDDLKRQDATARLWNELSQRDRATNAGTKCLDEVLAGIALDRRMWPTLLPESVMPKTLGALQELMAKVVRLDSAAIVAVRVDSARHGKPADIVSSLPPELRHHIHVITTIGHDVRTPRPRESGDHGVRAIFDATGTASLDAGL